MFSKEYFTYLLRSKKYLLLLIILITMLNILGNQMEGVMLLIQTFFSVVLSFAVPMDVFYHVHNKKAADTYFSIPVSRKSMMFTGIIYSVLVIFFPIACGLIKYGLGNDDISLILILAETLLTCASVTVFNTTLYLIGNNLIDGVVMMGAYTFMPLAVVLIINSFVYSYIAGLDSIEAFETRLLSPLYMGFYLIDNSWNGENIDVLSVIGLITVLLLFSYLLYRSYVNRAVERADCQSTGFFSYPFVINFYLIITLFLIASLYNYHYEGIIEFIRMHFFLYVLLFTVFIAAYFLYRRRFYFSYRLPLFYIAMLGITLLCASLCLNQNGFGLSEKYRKVYGTDYCYINIWEDEKGEIYDFVKEESGIDPEYVSTGIEIGRKDSTMSFSMNSNTSDLIDRYRKDAIGYFYENGNADYACGTLLIDENEEGSGRYYRYSLGECPDLEAIREFAKDPAVRVYILTYDSEYRLMPDGSLSVTDIYS